jgi:(p)ppGpp synthase/HD superfamily hydrolase
LNYSAVEERKEWLLVWKAADAAARWHVHHRRKGPAEEPYINHLLEVAMLVAEAIAGSDTNLVVAALLHGLKAARAIILGFWALALKSPVIASLRVIGNRVASAAT